MSTYSVRVKFTVDAEDEDDAARRVLAIMRVGAVAHMPTASVFNWDTEQSVVRVFHLDATEKGK